MSTVMVLRRISKPTKEITIHSCLTHINPCPCTNLPKIDHHPHYNLAHAKNKPSSSGEKPKMYKRMSDAEYAHKVKNVCVSFVIRSMSKDTLVKGGGCITWMQQLWQMKKSSWKPLTRSRTCVRQSQQKHVLLSVCML